jgi:secondary thiamine-phosphate synthase enzyme
MSFSTKGRRDVIDLTPRLKELVHESGVSDGIAIIFAPGSTAAVTTIECEPGLKKDIDLFLDHLAPYGAQYHHHETWHDDNGSAHLQAALIGPSLTIPLVGGSPVLGTWQQAVLIDCDTRPRKRTLTVQILW